MEDWQIQGLKMTAYKKSGLQKIANDLNKNSYALLRTIEKGGDIDLISYFLKEVIKNVNEVPIFIDEAVKTIEEKTKNID